MATRSEAGTTDRSEASCTPLSLRKVAEYAMSETPTPVSIPETSPAPEPEPQPFGLSVFFLTEKYCVPYNYV